MRIPPYYRLPTWQRFFAGVVIGAIGSWFIFFYMYGVLQEKQISIIEIQRKEIHELKIKVGIWEQDFNKLNEETEKHLSVKEIRVNIVNDRFYDLDKLSVAEAEEVIRTDLTTLITKNVEDVYKTKALLKKSIENKILEINKKRYRIEITEIFFYKNMEIEVKLHRL
ncbi:sporulation protein [Peribacillus psychrosaccharolyticus]|uniref:Sporulation protein n=1 Tax=Peribacillus psychrosaccharolyticus TaxID=1407 RepID=A0A974RZQ4_PERPY|nr:sporulation membrane protein YtrI [Peribacillus psychrosaccharolyticus]MEC2054705.1 sporulation protein [Peribacillus psychrosaccharolyticus]MED3744068.1 sporulation protein [Peribacillus psychrosaccharolyticus]QQS99562.1 sporulation protein [Peribacillus psychrosaccharolyticus]